MKISRKLITMIATFLGFVLSVFGAGIGINIPPEMIAGPIVPLMAWAIGRKIVDKKQKASIAKARKKWTSGDFVTALVLGGAGILNAAFGKDVIPTGYFAIIATSVMLVISAVMGKKKAA